jgi:hypothetical protein
LTYLQPLAVAEPNEPAEPPMRFKQGDWPVHTQDQTIRERIGAKDALEKDSVLQASPATPDLPANISQPTVPLRNTQPIEDSKDVHPVDPDDEFLKRYGERKGIPGKVMPWNSTKKQSSFRFSDWPFRTEDRVIRDRILWMIH